MESLKIEVEHLKGQITQLQDIRQKTQLASSSGVRGLKGDPGPAGPEGPIGPKGEPGTPVDITQVTPILEKLVSERLAKVSVPSKQSAAAVSTAAAVDTSDCIPVDSIKGAETIVLRAGNEFCDGTGRIIFKVKEINRYGRASFINPGGRDGACDPDRNCSINDDKYVYERRGSDDLGPTAMFRISRS